MEHGCPRFLLSYQLGCAGSDGKYCMYPSVSHLSFLPGALYSRKFTIDGEQLTLQVQDTPFVSLEVKWLFNVEMFKKKS